MLVEARAHADSGPLGAGPVAMPAQLEHPGTTLTAEQLNALWATDAMPKMMIDTIRADTGPTCFTDGFDGGYLHSVVYIEPRPRAELRLTAVDPYNGARVNGRDAPTIQWLRPRHPGCA